jgi:putative transposase
MMTSHVHMAIGTKGDNKLEDIIRDLKSYTSRHIRKYIENNPQESLKEYLLWMMERAASKNATVNKRQFWHGPTFRQHNHPIELATNEMMQQRIDYIHNNPVESLFVTNASDWIYSRAADYEGGKGLVDIYFLDWHGVFPKTFGRYGLSETLRPDQGEGFINGC